MIRSEYPVCKWGFHFFDTISSEKTDFLWHIFFHRNTEQSVSRLVKLKGAIRGAIDGSSLETTEVLTVWDASTDGPQVKFSFVQRYSYRHFFSNFVNHENGCFLAISDFL